MAEQDTKLRSRSVASKSLAVAEMEMHIDLTRSLMLGTEAMRAKGEEFLPKFAMEEPDTYSRRLKLATLHPAYARTVKTLTGKPFSKPINSDEVSPQIAELLDDIDLEGRNLDAFAAEGFEFTLGNGIAGILVEFPNVQKLNLPTNEAGLRSLAAEKEAGLRPYWVLIKAWQLLDIETERIRGKKVVTLLRFMETVEEKTDDEFTVVRVEQVRVIEPTRWRTYRQDKESMEWWLLHEEGVNTAGFVPYVPCYGDRTGYATGRPALLELAHLCVKHWQSQSDQDNLLHVARVPILTVNGVDPNDKKFKLVLGGTTFIKLPEGAELKYVEHTGTAISAGADSLKVLEDYMKEAGAELLLLEPGEVTATKTAADNEVGRCALQRITLGFQDALNLALDFTARWMGMGEDSAGEVKLFADFGAASLADASAQLLIGWNTSGKLSDQTTFEELQRRGTLRPDLTWDEEKERLAEQGPPLSDMQTEQSLDLGKSQEQRAQEDHRMSLAERRAAMQQQRQDEGNVVQMEKRKRFVQ